MRFQCFDVNRLPALGMRSGPPRSPAAAAGPAGGAGGAAATRRIVVLLDCWIVVVLLRLCDNELPFGAPWPGSKVSGLRDRCVCNRERV